MPLSEQEQKLLDEMERSLYHNDADFVSAVAPARGRINYGALVSGILLGIAGLVIVIVGVSLNMLLIGLAGFVVMFAAVLIALRPSKTPSPRKAATASRGQSASGSAPASGFMDRVNDRWDKRHDSDH